MMDEFAAAFRQEALELTGRLEALLLDLEAGSGLPESVNGIFRVMHTLKGGAGMCGFGEIQEIAHEFETLFDRIREGQIEPDAQIIDLTLRGKDTLVEMLGENIPAGHAAALLESVRRFTAGGGMETASAEAGNTAEGASENDYFIFFTPDAAIFERGLHPDKVLHELAALGPCHVIVHEGAESWEKQREGKTCTTSWEIYLHAALPLSEVEDVFLFYDPDEFRIFEKNSGLSDHLPELTGIAGRLHPGVSDVKTHLLANLARLTSETKPDAPAGAETSEPPETASAGKAEKNVPSEATIPVSSAKLDELMNLVSELVTESATLEACLSRSGDPVLHNTVEQLAKLTKRFRANALEIRLVPVGNLLSRFRRQIRDLAKELGKEVTLILEGNEVEIDKTILKSIENPLIHILRNSIDHGLESPGERLAKGKPREGLIKICAFHSGANVILQVQDDGRGINLDRVRETAVKKGYLQAGQSVTDAELLDLILEPGFSTSQNVSMVSGRGVGMDVVKRELNTIGGSLEVFTEKDLGTTLTLKLPTTLTIIDTLMVEVDRSTILVPMLDIEYCYNTDSREIRERTSPNLEYKGRLVPYLDLRRRFHFPESQSGDRIVLILNKFDKTYAIVADRIVGEYQAVIKPLGDLFMNQPYFTGASIMVDGKLALILDTNSLFTQINRN